MGEALHVLLEPVGHALKMFHGLQEQVKEVQKDRNSHWPQQGYRLDHNHMLRHWFVV